MFGLDNSKTLYCAQKINGFTLPEWVNTLWEGETVYEKLTGMQNLGYELSASTPFAKRLLGGTSYITPCIAYF